MGKIPWIRAWQLTPVFLPGKFHGQKSLAGYSPWGHKRVGHNWVTDTLLSHFPHQHPICQSVFILLVQHSLCSQWGLHRRERIPHGAWSAAWFWEWDPSLLFSYSLEKIACYPGHPGWSLSLSKASTPFGGTKKQIDSTVSFNFGAMEEWLLASTL